MGEENRNESRADREARMADSARAAMPEVVEEEAPMAGKPLPEGFVNPPRGKPGHRCLDQRNLYQPKWFSLILHKINENMPQRQYFNMNGKQWLVQVGVWVDVPKEIITLLGYTEQEVISMNMKDSDMITNRSVPMVVDRVPRFSTSMIASA